MTRGTATRFDIIATLGPASWHLATELVRAGATALRINTSHLAPGSLQPRLLELREQSAGVPIVIDLQGAKMRLGWFEERRVSRGDELALLLEPRTTWRTEQGCVPIAPIESANGEHTASLFERVATSERAESVFAGRATSPIGSRRQAGAESSEACGSRESPANTRMELGRASDFSEVPLPHSELSRQLLPGDTLTVDDGRLTLRVDHVELTRLIVTSMRDGLLRPRKGVNVMEHPVELEGLSLEDQSFLREGLPFEGVSWAISFMTDGREAGWVRSKAPHARVIGKIERREAVESIHQVAAACDELWVCRGDLGEQLGLLASCSFVASLDPLSIPRPVMMAGQVLEHLTHHMAPTRSESCHLFDLVSRGYSGIVLSDETAIGHQPIEAVKTARNLTLAFFGSRPA